LFQPVQTSKTGHSSQLVKSDGKANGKWTIRITFLLIHCLLIALLALPVLSQAITLWWLDNLINLQFQLSLLAFILVLVSRKYLRSALIPLSLLYIAIIFYNFSPLYKIDHPNHQGKETLNIAQLNISYENPNIDKIISGIGDADYDVILIQEVADNKVGEIGKLAQFYPYSVGSKSPDGYTSGLALFSRWPIASRKVHDLGYVEGKIIEADIHTPDKNTPVKIFALHPGAPRNEMLWQLRNTTLAFVAAQVSASSSLYNIVIGDINTSPWSPVFKSLKNSGQLQNSANGYGYIPSWARYGSNKLVRLITSVYIDHCLVSKSFKINNKEYQTVNGSDHVLISTELGFE